jgi:hypothetical protein
MSNPSNKKSLTIILSVVALIVGGTFLISIIARGYQLNFKNLKSGSILQATGILSATSNPKAASVFIDDRLVTATDDTLNLSPGQYTIKISKDGYLPWQKTIQIKKETVYQSNAQLFRSVSDLRPITLSGAINPIMSPDGSKIIYAVASASASLDNGLYQIALNDSIIPLGQNLPRQLAPNFPNIDWSKFTFSFSPNSRQVLANFKDTHYLISLDSPITLKNIQDVTARLSLIKEDWQNQSLQMTLAKLDHVPAEIKNLVSTDSAKNISLSPSEDKIFYLAKTDGQVKENIVSPPPAQSTQTQTRQVKKGNFYVYDLKDDTNFLIGNNSALLNPLWLPNSNDIVFIEDNKIKVIEYDGTNKQILFAGNFNKDTVFPWSDGSKIVTLTSAYIGAPENLYSISIR